MKPPDSSALWRLDSESATLLLIADHAAPRVILFAQRLDARTTYEVTLQSSNLSELSSFSKIIPSWCKDTMKTFGELLMTPGLPLPVMPPQSALLIGCRRIST